MFFDQHRGCAQCFRTAKRKSEVSSIVDSFEQQEKRGRRLFYQLEQLTQRRPRLGGADRENTAVRIP